MFCLRSQMFQSGVTVLLVKSESGDLCSTPVNSLAHFISIPYQIYSLQRIGQLYLRFINVNVFFKRLNINQLGFFELNFFISHFTDLSNYCSIICSAIRGRVTLSCLSYQTNSLTSTQPGKWVSCSISQGKTIRSTTSDCPCFLLLFFITSNQMLMRIEGGHIVLFY